MGRRHSQSNYNNVLTPAAITPAPTPTAASTVTPMVSQVQSLLSALLKNKSANTIPFSIPALPVGEVLGGVSNMVRGLVLNGNWWVVLLIIFLFFPNISSKMFGGLFKE